MYKNAELVIMQAITPVHVGSGSDLGMVDLPIQREKHSGYPKFESSGLKGCIRQAVEDAACSEEAVYDIHNLFGYDGDSLDTYMSDNCIINIHDEVEAVFKDNEQFAGCIGFTDGKILLFPVASAKGVYALITCQNVLQRFAEEAIFSGYELAVPEFDQDETAYCYKDTSLAFKGKGDAETIVVEEYTYTGSKVIKNELEGLIDQLSECTGISAVVLKKKLLIVPDDDFKDLVNMQTEVITRTKIDNKTGTVATGALFTEEYLPVETVMYSSLLYSVSFSVKMKNSNAKEKQYSVAKVKEKFANLRNDINVLQIGAGSSIGKGLVQITFHGKKQ